jgi:putative component of membrane protein insertase Oxa1/YidC/SpoIIIJ protein YidD
MVFDQHSGPLVSSVPGRVRFLMSVLILLTASIAFAGIADRDDDELGDPPKDPAGAALDFYQHYLSSLRHTRCPFHPSCSEYARQAITQYGLFSGTARAADRLVRCNSSAGRFYSRAENGRLDDPVQGASHGPVVPRLEQWLLPAFEMDPPPVPASESASTEVVGRIDEIISFARQLAVDCDCPRAETEYLRVAHLSRSDDWRLWSHFQIGACYFEAGFWADAELSYLQVGMLSTDIAQQALAGHLLAASLFNDGRYSGGTKLLRDPGLTPRALALRGLCRMARGKWDAAAADFAAGVTEANELVVADGLASSDGLVLAKRLEYLGVAATAGSGLPHRSPGLAKVMSMVIPGTGQMYAGRVHDGFRHLLFNGILIYTIVKLIQNEHYPAALGVTAIELPFYLGNIRGGGYSARAFNRDRRLEHVAGAIIEAGGIYP